MKLISAWTQKRPTNEVGRKGRGKVLHGERTRKDINGAYVVR